MEEEREGPAVKFLDADLGGACSSEGSAKAGKGVNRRFMRFSKDKRRVLSWEDSGSGSDTSSGQIGCSKALQGRA